MLSLCALWRLDAGQVLASSPGSTLPNSRGAFNKVALAGYATVAVFCLHLALPYRRKAPSILLAPPLVLSVWGFIYFCFNLRVTGNLQVVLGWIYRPKGRLLREESTRTINMRKQQSLGDFHYTIHEGADLIPYYIQMACVLS